MFRLFKKKKIQIENRERLITVMSRIVEILKHNGLLVQADAVNKPLLDLFQHVTDQVLKNINTVDIWGGAGAAWEV